MVPDQDHGPWHEPCGQFGGEYWPDTILYNHSHLLHSMFLDLLCCSPTLPFLWLSLFPLFLLLLLATAKPKLFPAPCSICFLVWIIDPGYIQYYDLHYYLIILCTKFKSKRTSQVFWLVVVYTCCLCTKWYNMFGLCSE